MRAAFVPLRGCGPMRAKQCTTRMISDMYTVEMRSIAIVLLVACGMTSHMDPPGSFGVGVQTKTFIDTSRPTPAHGLAPLSPQRKLVTEIWYPAAPGTPGPETANAPIASGGPFPL